MTGVRVIELAAWVAGPAADAVLADWGADVIKIEPPTGDPFRYMVRLRHDGSNPAFELDNRGKRSLGLDVSTDGGRDLLHRLLDGADVFLSNLRPGTLATLGLGGPARELLRVEGYTEATKLSITLWYVNDGRYSANEEAYATAIKAQLEETGVFQVELAGAGWDEIRLQISQCGLPAYLLGWPSPGQPTSYLDVSSWTDFFVINTDRVFCSNYESERMTNLVADARAEVEEGARLELYGRIQTLWAAELPTLPLTQEPRRAVSLPTIDGVRIDALGLMHYEWLTKAGE